MICCLVRHGKDDDTVRGGWSQQPLTDEGEVQAAELAVFVQKSGLGIQQVYSSDLLRAMQTAQIIADSLRLPIVPKPEFREVNNGNLAGIKNELAAEQYPGLYWNTLAWEQQYPGGESPKEFYERIRCAWDVLQKDILERNENVMLVTHGGVMHVILSIVKGEIYSNQASPRKIRNAELIALKYQSGKWTEQDIEITAQSI